jgi:hypothetical protein
VPCSRGVRPLWLQAGQRLAFERGDHDVAAQGDEADVALALQHRQENGFTAQRTQLHGVAMGFGQIECVR